MRSLPGSTKPSSTISALAGIGSPVTGPLMTSTGLPRPPPPIPYSPPPSATSPPSLPRAHVSATAHPVGPPRGRHEEGPGIAAANHGDRHRRAARLVLVAHLTAMLARRDVEARGLGVMDHHAIGAAIDPALVGIAGDVE